MEDTSKMTNAELIVFQGKEIRRLIAEVEAEREKNAHLEELWGPAVDFIQAHASELGVELGHSKSKFVMNLLKERISRPTPSLASASDLEEAEKAVDIAATELGRLCDARWKGGEAWERVWHWEIPANEERDTDLKIGKAISICKDLIAEVRRLRALPSPAAPGEKGKEEGK